MFRLIRKYFYRFLGIKPKVKHRPVAIPKPIDENDRTILKAAKYALIPGHNESSPGAFSFKFLCPDGVKRRISENAFWKERFNNIQIKLADHGLYAPIINRPSGVGYTYQCESVADEIEKAGILYSFHGHFNSASALVIGTEILIPVSTTKEDDLIADYMTDLLNKELGFKERGKDGVRTIKEGHRGSKMLYLCRKAGTIGSFILEPTFGNWENDESKILFQHPELIEDIIVRTILAIENGEIKDLD